MNLLIILFPENAFINWFGKQYDDAVAYICAIKHYYWIQTL